MKFVKTFLHWLFSVVNSPGTNNRNTFVSDIHIAYEEESPIRKTDLLHDEQGI